MQSEDREALQTLLFVVFGTSRSSRIASSYEIASSTLLRYAEPLAKSTGWREAGRCDEQADHEEPVLHAAERLERVVSRLGDDRGDGGSLGQGHFARGKPPRADVDHRGAVRAPALLPPLLERRPRRLPAGKRGGQHSILGQQDGLVAGRFADRARELLIHGDRRDDVAEQLPAGFGRRGRGVIRTAADGHDGGLAAAVRSRALSQPSPDVPTVSAVSVRPSGVPEGPSATSSGVPGLRCW